MSVVIKGMDAPKCCFGCRYRSEICGLHSRCSITNQIILYDEYNKVADDCPIKSIDGLISSIVSMPCGVTSMKEIYVNRDKVIEIIKEYCEVK